MPSTFRINYLETFLLVILSLLSPLLALPFVLFSIYKKNIFSIYALAIIATLFIGLMSPRADSYHYYIVFSSTVDFSLQGINPLKQDVIFYLLSYIFNVFNWPYMSLRFLIAFIELFAFAWIVVDFLKNNFPKNCNQYKFLLSVLVCFLSLDLMFIAFMLRFSMMGTFLILSLYMFYKKRVLLAVTCYLLGILSHFSGFLFLPCFICFFLSPKKISLITKIFLVSICLILGKMVFVSIYEYFFYMDRSSTYIYGAWSGFDAKSFNGMLYYILQYYVIGGILIVFYLFTTTTKEFFARFAFYVILLFCTICSFSEMSQRIFMLARIFISFALLRHYLALSGKKLIPFVFIFLILCFSQMLVLYGLRDSILLKENLEHFLSPLTFMIEEEYNDAYFFRRGVF